MALFFKTAFTMKYLMYGENELFRIKENGKFIHTEWSYFNIIQSVKMVS